MKKLYIIILFAILSLMANAQVCLQPTIYNPSSPLIATADFNKDGKPDLAINYGDSIRTMFGDGLGSFNLGVKTITYLTAFYPGPMTTADFNKDGNVDIAYDYYPGSGSGYIVIFFGTGTGSFSNHVLVSVGTYPWAIISNDYDGDGNPDIAVGNGGSNVVSVLLGDGTGNFTAHTDSVGADIAGMADGDFNGDGKPDLAVGFNVGNGMGGKVAVLLNMGAGNFSTPTNFVNGSYDPYDLTIADFNGDGNLDVVTSTGNSDVITLLLGDGTGHLNTATTFTLGHECNDILNADFNLDGKQDVAVADMNSNYISLFLGTGTGSFSPAINYPDMYVPQTIVSADLNLDGKPDLIAGNQQGGNMMVFLNVAAPNLSLISSSLHSLCLASSATLTVSGATTYTWSANSGVLGPRDSINPTDSSTIHLPGNYTVTQVAVTPSVNTTYSVVAQTNGCLDSASFSFNIVMPQTPNICMVTTDSTTNYNYNIVYWDKTSYSNVDSFIVYRKDALSSNYLRIGAVSKNSLSEFIDTAFSIGGPNGGNPQYSSWTYKLAIRDTCGNIGAKSPYHQTMFVQESGSNFSWNAYGVESGQTNSVTGYSFLRDNTNTGSWHVLVNTTSNSATDPNYSSYPGGNWRVDAIGFSCTPTLRLASNNNTQSIYAKAHSNATKPIAATGLQQLSADNLHISLYPNPTNGNFIIETNSLEKQIVQLIDVTGKVVLTQAINSNATIDASSLSEGVYNMSIRSSAAIVNKRLVIVK